MDSVSFRFECQKVFCLCRFEDAVFQIYKNILRYENSRIDLIDCMMYSWYIFYEAENDRHFFVECQTYYMFNAKSFLKLLKTKFSHQYSNDPKSKIHLLPLNRTYEAGARSY